MYARVCCIRIRVCVRLDVRMSSSVWLCATATRIRSVVPSSVTEGLGHNSDLCPLWTQYIGDWRPIHGMIRRSVSVRAVKTRRRFGSETASFHVSVRSCAFPYLPLSVGIYILHLSFHVTFYYILPVWLLIPLHETSMIVHFIYLVNRSLYQRHFMYW